MQPNPPTVGALIINPRRVRQKTVVAVRCPQCGEIVSLSSGFGRENPVPFERAAIGVLSTVGPAICSNCGSAVAMAWPAIVRPSVCSLERGLVQVEEADDEGDEQWKTVFEGSFNDCADWVDAHGVYARIVDAKSEVEVAYDGRARQKRRLVAQRKARGIDEGAISAAVEAEFPSSTSPVLREHAVDLEVEKRLLLADAEFSLREALKAGKAGQLGRYLIGRSEGDFDRAIEFARTLQVRAFHVELGPWARRRSRCADSALATDIGLVSLLAFMSAEIESDDDGLVEYRRVCDELEAIEVSGEFLVWKDAPIGRFRGIEGWGTAA